MPGQFAGHSVRPPQTPPLGSDRTDARTSGKMMDQRFSHVQKMKNSEVKSRFYDEDRCCHLIEDVHHGFTGQVLQVLSVLAEALEELHTSQHHLRLLQRHRTELRERNTAAARTHSQPPPHMSECSWGAQRQEGAGGVGWGGDINLHMAAG